MDERTVTERRAQLLFFFRKIWFWIFFNERRLAPLLRRKHTLHLQGNSTPSAQAPSFWYNLARVTSCIDPTTKIWGAQGTQLVQNAAPFFLLDRPGSISFPSITVTGSECHFIGHQPHIPVSGFERWTVKARVRAVRRGSSSKLWTCTWDF